MSTLYFFFFFVWSRIRPWEVMTVATESPDLVSLAWSFVGLSCRLPISVPHITRIKVTSVSLRVWVRKQGNSLWDNAHLRISNKVFVTVPANYRNKCHCSSLFCDQALCLPEVPPASVKDYSCLTIPGCSGGIWHRGEPSTHCQSLLCPWENFLLCLLYEAKSHEKCKVFRHWLHWGGLHDRQTVGKVRPLFIFYFENAYILSFFKHIRS